jgi:hypothetical protein
VEAVGADPYDMIDAELSYDGDQRHIPLGSGFVNDCLVLSPSAPFISTDTARIRVNTQGGQNRVNYFFSDYFTIRPDPGRGSDRPGRRRVFPGWRGRADPLDCNRRRGRAWYRHPGFDRRGSDLALHCRGPAARGHDVRLAIAAQCRDTRRTGSRDGQRSGISDVVRRWRLDLCHHAGLGRIDLRPGARPRPRCTTWREAR